MNKIFIVQELIDALNATVYLELGVGEGTCFLNLFAPKKIGVDKKFRIPPNQKFTLHLSNVSNLNNEYYELSTKEFFASAEDTALKRGVDVAFLKGFSSFEESYSDVIRTLNVLNPGGVILVRNCNPLSEHATVSIQDNPLPADIPIPEMEWCGNVWKTIVAIRSLHHDLQAFVLDFDCGLGVITKGKPANTLSYSIDDISKLTYQDLNANREILLNLQPAEFLWEFSDELRKSWRNRKETHAAIHSSDNVINTST